MARDHDSTTPRTECPRRRYRDLMLRRLGYSALLLGVVTVLSACTPGSTGILGIERNANGTLTVLIRVCSDSLDEIRMRPVNSFPNEPDGEPLNDNWEAVADMTAALPHTVEGSADVPFPFVEDELEPDVLYDLWASGGRQGNAHKGLFGAAELATLQPGEVLTRPSRDDEPSEYVRGEGSGGVYMLVTREEFERRAEAFCR